MIVDLVIVVRWHQLTVVHKGQLVDARLDATSERMTADRPDPHLRMPPSVYFGGMDVSASVQGQRRIFSDG